MPYKDKEKQREAVRKSVAKLRARNKGYYPSNTQAVKPPTPPEICVNCPELKLTLSDCQKQLEKFQAFYELEMEKKRKKWRAQKKRLQKKSKMKIKRISN